MVILTQARGRLMFRLADLMEQHLPQLALLESLDAGGHLPNVEIEYNKTSA